MLGETPNWRGPSPNGNDFKYGKMTGDDDHSRAASCTFIPAPINDSHKRGTE